MGRAETSVKVDVPIAHGTTSTRHATVVCNAGNASLIDMKSTNGTFHNQQRLGPQSPVPIRSGDSIRFGGYNVTIFVITSR
ncbi:MAG: FHA domain-containing protein [Deltaproteobacteria bacterium]|nr:FHA domain-containing protein [Deltaproteobacteria bacterium]